MTTKRKLKGTGNLFQDLLCSNISLSRCKAYVPSKKIHVPSPRRADVKLDSEVEKEELFCCICGRADDKELDELSKDERTILEEMLMDFPVSLFDKNYELLWRCSPCAAVLRKLSMLKRQIEAIRMCLRTVFKIRAVPSSVNRQSTDLDSAIEEPTMEQHIRKEDFLENCSWTVPPLTRLEENEYYVDVDTAQIPLTHQEEDSKPILVEMELEMTDEEDDFNDDLEQIRQPENDLSSGEGDDDHAQIELTFDNGDSKPTLIDMEFEMPDGEDKDDNNMNEGDHETNSLASPTGSAVPNCYICGQTFTRLDSLQRHLRNKGIHKRLQKKADKHSHATNDPDKETVVEEANDAKQVSSISDDDATEHFKQDDADYDMIVDVELIEPDVSSVPDKSSRTVQFADPTSEKPTCGICGVSFSRMCDLTRHIRYTRTHPRIIERVADVESNSTTGQGAIITKRQSRTRAEELLRSMTQEESEGDEDDGSSQDSSESWDEDDEINDQAEKSGSTKIKQNQAHPNRSCNQCGKSFNRIDRLLNHLLIHSEEGDGISPKPHCQICVLDFPCEQSLELHLLSNVHKVGLKSKKIKEDGVVDFICKKCTKSFNVLNDLLEHQQTTQCARIPHRKTVTCQVCNLKFKSDWKYKRHLASRGHITRVSLLESSDTNKERLIVPQDERPNQTCKQCGKAFRLNFNLLKHLVRHGREGKNPIFPKPHCKTCVLDFPCEQSLELHLLTNVHKDGLISRSSKDDMVEFKCQKCSQSFNLLNDLRKHQSKKCSITPTCDLCNKEYTKKSSYYCHLTSVEHMTNLNKAAGKDSNASNERNFKCSLCPSSFFCRRKLRRHQLSHTRPFVCEICGRGFAAIANLKSHQETHNKEKVVTIPNRFIAPQDKQFPCKQCPKRFAKKSSMFTHVQTVHKGHRYKCQLCPKDFSSCTAFIRHKKTAHSSTTLNNINKSTNVKRVQCDICHKEFSTNQRLSFHLEATHFPDKSVCPYGCTDTFEMEEEWATHLEQCNSTKMTEKSRCYCFFCGDLFRNQLLRILHHFKKHTTYPCEICKKEFTQKCRMEKHILSHEEREPLFQCTKCGKRFKQEWNLKLHSTTVCGDDDAAREAMITKRRELHRLYREKKKPLKCNLCEKRFVLTVRLEAHERKAHGDEDGDEEEEESDAD